MRAAARRVGVLASLALLPGLLLLPAPSAFSASPTDISTEENQAKPERVTRVFGHSVKGRDLVVHRVGDPDAKRRVLVVGCIHGNECAGRKVVRELRRLDPPEGTVHYLVPTLNPDGFVRGTRQNARGVDLNRNFPRKWKQRARGTYYAGRQAFSERETRAAIRLIERVRPTFTVWYHQQMSLVDFCGGSRKAARSYARRADARLTRLPRYGGSASTWQRARWPRATILIAELTRQPSERAVARHTAAVVRAAQVAPARRGRA